MALPLAKLRLYLSLIPLLRTRPGVTFKEIGEHLGLSPQAVAREIPDALNLCGVPPYLPHDYLACFTEGDRVTLRFADHFKRPARLTMSEAAALLLALRALPPARGSPLAPAVAGLIRKLERALGMPVKSLARQIAVRRASGALGRRVALLQEALEAGHAVEIEYYTQRRRALSKRRVKPYGIVDHLGHYYLVGKDSVRNRELSFRIDRIRSVQATDETFEKPKTFTAQRYRRPEIYRPGPEDVKVRVRFAAPAARYVKEVSSPSELEEKRDGTLERKVRTDSLRWVVDWSLQHGDHACVIGPKEAVAEARNVLDEWLEFYARKS